MCSPARHCVRRSVPTVLTASLRHGSRLGLAPSSSADGSFTERSEAARAFLKRDFPYPEDTAPTTRRWPIRAQEIGVSRQALGGTSTAGPRQLWGYFRFSVVGRRSGSLDRGLRPGGSRSPQGRQESRDGPITPYARRDRGECPASSNSGVPDRSGATSRWGVPRVSAKVGRTRGCRSPAPAGPGVPRDGRRRQKSERASQGLITMQATLQGFLYLWYLYNFIKQVISHCGQVDSYIFIVYIVNLFPYPGCGHGPFSTWLNVITLMIF